MKRHISILSAALAVSIIFVAGTYLILEKKAVTKVHKLEFPLLVTSDEALAGIHMLPKGTVLYFDKSYPEGFARYKVYVNIDRMPLELTELSDATTIEPIEAAAPSKEELVRILRDYPLTKNDLKALLGAPGMSKEDIKEILEEFSR